MYNVIKLDGLIDFVIRKLINTKYEIYMEKIQEHEVFFYKISIHRFKMFDLKIYPVCE